VAAIRDEFESPARVWDLICGQWEALAKTDKQAARERADLTQRIERLNVASFGGPRAARRRPRRSRGHVPGPT
jgi:hypothetical protein